MTTAMDDITKKLDGFDALMLDKLSGLDAWRSSTNSAMDKLLMSSEDTTQRLHRLETAPSIAASAPPLHHHRPATAPPQPPSRWVNPFDLNTAPHQEARPSAPSGERPNGHRIDMNHRGVGGGILGSHPPHPVTSTSPPPSLELSLDSRPGSSRPPYLPKMEFPKFNGENPRLWVDRCETYFELFCVGDNLKTRFAALNFSGPAASWLQTIELRGGITSWDETRKAVCARFDKDQYQISLRHLDNLIQSGSVSEYYDTFEQLSHTILLYNPSYDDTYFVTRFLSGLKDELRTPIALHRPTFVESASALALLQEEELLHQKKLGSSRFSVPEFTKPVTKTFSQQDKQKPKSEVKKPVDSKQPDKLEFLMAYRKQKGSYFKCGEPWNKQHKCPAQVPLHVIEELLEVIDYSDSDDSDTADLGSSADASLMVVNDTQQKRHTMQFKGLVGKQEILVLVDSDSVYSFLSTQMATHLQCKTHSIPAEQFSVADGGTVQCTSMVQDFQWWTQGHSFIQDVRVLDLGSFDLILGADWLEDHSPMWIHW